MPCFNAPKIQPRYARDDKGRRTAEVVGEYHRPRLADSDQAKRAAARREITAAATRASDRNSYSRRQLQQAVAICRQQGLVSDKTLALAGFNTKAVA